MIKVKVEIFAFLKEYVPTEYKEGANFILLDNFISVSDLTKVFSIPNNIEKITIVNEKYVSPDYILKDGDSVKIFPPVPGG